MSRQENGMHQRETLREAYNKFCSLQKEKPSSIPLSKASVSSTTDHRCCPLPTTSVSYSEAPRFKSQFGERLSWLKLLVVFVSPSI